MPSTFGFKTDTCSGPLNYGKMSEHKYTTYMCLHFKLIEPQLTPTPSGRQNCKDAMPPTRCQGRSQPQDTYKPCSRGPMEDCSIWQCVRRRGQENSALHKVVGNGMMNLLRELHGVLLRMFRVLAASNTMYVVWADAGTKLTIQRLDHCGDVCGN